MISSCPLLTYPCSRSILDKKYLPLFHTGHDIYRQLYHSEVYQVHLDLYHKFGGSSVQSSFLHHFPYNSYILLDQQLEKI